MAVAQAVRCSEQGLAKHRKRAVTTATVIDPCALRCGAGIDSVGKAW